MTVTSRRRSRPRVILDCVADHYTRGEDRIVEFTSEAGGGLISLRVVNGRLKVEVYRTDDTVDVIAPEKK
jgi:hypothetical protein